MLEKKTYKNWRELCEAMGWKYVAGGNQRISRLKKLECLCKYHKEKQAYIIDEIYEFPLKKIHKGCKEYPSLIMSVDEYDHVGIYKITLDNNIYIGSTINGFKRRFQEHYYGTEKLMKHTYELIKNGGIFEILEDMTGCTEEMIREKEVEYIKFYRDNEDWVLVNHRTHNNKQYINKHKRYLFNGVHKNKVIQKKFNDLVEQEKVGQTNNVYYAYIDFKQYVFDTYNFEELL